MPVEIIFRAVNNDHALGDDLVDRCTYKRGDPIEMLPSKPNFSWGTIPESSDRFLSITVTDATIEEVREYLADYKQRIDYEIVNSNTAIDGWRLRFYVSNMPVTGGLGLTLEQVENYFAKFNISIFSHAPNEVVVDALVKDVVMSAGFWRVKTLTGKIIITEVSYTEASGEHIFNVDYSETKARPALLAVRVERAGGVILSHNTQNKTGLFSIKRSDVFTHFKKLVDARDEVKHYNIRRKRFRLPESACAYIESQGRHHVPVTKAQLLAQLIDKVNE